MGSTGVKADVFPRGGSRFGETGVYGGGGGAWFTTIKGGNDFFFRFLGEDTEDVGECGKADESV